MQKMQFSGLSHDGMARGFSFIAQLHRVLQHIPQKNLINVFKRIDALEF